jgi:drug/metabolite transporter (DMT)-like permease
VFAVGLSGALAAAASYTALKQAAIHWSPMTLTWGISLSSIPVTLIRKHGPWVSLDRHVALPLLSIAVLCTVGQLFLALSYRWAELSTATAIVPSTMAFGVFFDVIMGAPAGGRQLLGCLIYLSGCIPLTFMRLWCKFR